MAELTKTLAVIQTELKAKKSSYNSFGKYYFRKAEDILEAAKPFLTKHNVYVKVGAASTYGKKYALGNLFLIDDTEDADATNNHSTTPTVTKKKITDAQMKKAIEFVSGGGDIKAILAKYTMSPAELTALKKLVK